MKNALITGITGQGVTYLATLLQRKGTEVRGIKSFASSVWKGKPGSLKPAARKIDK